MAAKLTIKTGKKRNENYYKMQNMTKSYALPEIRTSRHQDKTDKIVQDENSSVDKVRGFTPKSCGEVDVLYSGSPEESRVELIKNPEGFKTIELAKPEKQAGRNMVNRSIDIAYLQ
jgi:predicted aconitase